MPPRAALGTSRHGASAFLARGCVPARQSSHGAQKLRRHPGPPTPTPAGSVGGATHVLQHLRERVFPSTSYSREREEERFPGPSRGPVDLILNPRERNGRRQNHGPLARSTREKGSGTRPTRARATVPSSVTSLKGKPAPPSPLGQVGCKASSSQDTMTLRRQNRKERPSLGSFWCKNLESSIP